MKLFTSNQNFENTFFTLKLSLFFALLLFSGILTAQDRILRDSDREEAEFSTAIDPQDSNNIILATMHGFEEITESFLTIYYTSDFGETWNISDFHGKYSGHLGAGDPVVYFDNKGNAYLVNLVVTADDQVRTILSRSEDGGQTWTQVYIYDDVFTDKPWLCIDRSTSSEHYGNTYIPVVSDQLVLITLDSNFQQINNTVIPNGAHLPSVVVAKDGDVFTCNNSLNDPNELYRTAIQRCGSNAGPLNTGCFFP